MFLEQYLLAQESPPPVETLIEESDSLRAKVHAIESKISSIDISHLPSLAAEDPK